METGKRKFSARRLYKLAGLLVIVISILSGISAYLNYRTIEHYSQQIIKFDGEYPKKDDESNLNLRLNTLNAQQEVQDRFLLLSVITIGLPITFFGGTGLYRYLFTIQKEGKCE